MLQNLGNQTNWPYENRMKETLCGYEYSESLAGPESVHIHFWITKSITPDHVKKLAKEARYYRDVVSYSYDFVPDIHEPVVFVSYSVKEVLDMLETYELSLDMTEAEIHAALLYAARCGYEFSDGVDLIEGIKSAHKVLTTH